MICGMPSIGCGQMAKGPGQSVAGLKVITEIEVITLAAV